MAQIGPNAWRALPTLCWLDGTTFLHLLCGGGALAALLVFLGFVPVRPWPSAGCSTSLVGIDGQVFLEFQWDTLLLEAGFLAICLAPGGRRFGGGWRSATIARGLLFVAPLPPDVLLGRVKLASGDRELAKPDGVPLPLLNAAPAALDRVVPAPLAALVLKPSPRSSCSSSSSSRRFFSPLLAE